MSTKQDWLAAKAELDAIEAERAALLEPSDARYMAAMEKLQDVEETSGELLGRCVGCSDPIFEGEKCHHGTDEIMCQACAPTYQDMLNEPEHFVDHDEEPLTPEAAKARVDAHIASGGALTDPVAS